MQEDKIKTEKYVETDLWNFSEIICPELRANIRGNIKDVSDKSE